MNKHAVLQGSVLRALLFLIYMNDLPEFINNKSIPTLFAATSVLFTHSHTTEFNANTDRVFEIINIGLQDNYRSLNFEKKTRYIHSKTRNLLIIKLVLIINQSPVLYIPHLLG